jgi:hypothetical protein
LRNRFEASSYLQRYVSHIKERETSLAEKKGFLANILSYLEADIKADREEINQITRLIRKRFRIANSIFSVLQERDRQAAAE